jgi:hypothetical protein
VSCRLLIASLFLLLSTSCASGQGGQPDASRADSRIRADASPNDGGTDDASLVDAMPGIDADLSQPDAPPTPANLLITEIVDATLTGGLPKYVEVTNIGGMGADLSGYSVGIYSNGNSTLQSTSKVLSGSLAAGSSYVISFEDGDSAGSGSFFTVYAADPDFFDFAALINGNDVVALFLADGGGTAGAATGDGSDATLVDLYGVVAAGGSPDGGTGEVWEYTDGFATRKQSTTGPTATFTPAEWQFSGVDALEALDAGEIAALTSPGSF